MKPSTKTQNNQGTNNTRLLITYFRIVLNSWWILLLLKRFPSKILFILWYIKSIHLLIFRKMLFEPFSLKWLFTINKKSKSKSILNHSCQLHVLLLLFHLLRLISLELFHCFNPPLMAFQTPLILLAYTLDCLPLLEILICFLSLMINCNIPNDSKIIYR